TALEVMGEMVFAPSFAELDAEREVVLEEIAMYEDQPQELVHDLISEATFGRHPLGRPVIGRAEVISSVSRRTISSYHRGMYVPGNVVVSAAGNLRHDDLQRLLLRAQRKAVEPVRKGPRVRPLLVKPPAPSLRFQRKDTEQYHVCIAAPGIARSDKRRFAASLLDGILGGSASSRLFQEIREKRGMAYAVYSFASQYTDSGIVGVYLGTREENLRACVEICAAEVADLAAGNLRPRELERAKENLKGRIMLGMESTSSRMSRLGKSLITDTELLSFERIMAEIDAVEAEQVCELADVLLAPAKLSVAGIGPSEERFNEAARVLNPALLARPAAAVGAALMLRFAAEAAKVFPSAAIVELHSEAKVDAPSGTATATSALLGGQTPIHSVRLPGLVAHQEVLFGGEGQLLTIRHDAFSREAYVP